MREQEGGAAGPVRSGGGAAARAGRQLETGSWNGGQQRCAGGAGALQATTLNGWGRGNGTDGGGVNACSRKFGGRGRARTG